jgi:hypothetical protein
LLAEASLQNSHRKKMASVDGSGASNKGKAKDSGHGAGQQSDEGVGVGNEHYFKPGELVVRGWNGAICVANAAFVRLQVR